MSAEWPHSVQDTTHSIQDTYSEPTASEERTPLLRSRNSAFARVVWVSVFLVFFCVAFGAGIYLLVAESTERPISQRYNYTIVTRSKWQARKKVADIPHLQIPVEHVLLTNTNSPECTKQSDCSQQILELQNDHLDELQQPDIGYNFLIAGDGRTYEGLGWKYRAMISSSDNSTVVVAFVGVFNNSLPSAKQLSQAKDFLNAAEHKGKLTPCYSVSEKVSSPQARSFFRTVELYFQQFFKSRQKICS